MNRKVYASLLKLDRYAVKALRITDPYALHRVVYSLFEDVRSENDKISGKSSGILYRDEGGDFFYRQILMLSDRLPESAVNGMYGEVISKDIPDSFLEHRKYSFETVVNPCIRNNATGKLVPVKGHSAIADWFCSRAETGWGFKVHRHNLETGGIEVMRFKGKHKRQITIQRASLKGVLEVTDGRQFSSSFCQGIGRGRAFGCGLLKIVPLS